MEELKIEATWQAAQQEGKQETQIRIQVGICKERMRQKMLACGGAGHPI